MSCALTIPNTFIACGEGGNYCSDECQAEGMWHSGFDAGFQQEAQAQADIDSACARALFWKCAAKRFWGDANYCSDLARKNYATCVRYYDEVDELREASLELAQATAREGLEHARFRKLYKESRRKREEEYDFHAACTERGATLFLDLHEAAQELAAAVAEEGREANFWDRKAGEQHEEAMIANANASQFLVRFMRAAKGADELAGALVDSERENARLQRVIRNFLANPNQIGNS